MNRSEKAPPSRRACPSRRISASLSSSSCAGASRRKLSPLSGLKSPAVKSARDEVIAVSCHAAACRRAPDCWGRRRGWLLPGFAIPDSCRVGKGAHSNHPADTAHYAPLPTIDAGLERPRGQRRAPPWPRRKIRPAPLPTLRVLDSMQIALSPWLALSLLPHRDHAPASWSPATPEVGGRRRKPPRLPERTRPRLPSTGW